MCLGRVANRLFGSRDKPKPPQETPDPVGQESPTKEKTESSDEKERKVPESKPDPDPPSSTSSESSYSDTGINY